MEIKKRCSKCKTQKDISDFGKKKYNKDGLNHYCLICERSRVKTNYATKTSYRERVNYGKIFRNYGLTKQEYVNKLELQNNACAICKTHLSNDRNTHLYHCHESGVIRDILCKKCNMLVGVIECNLANFKLCIDYIKRHNCGE
jgi:nuclear transport factor 2 (NTF2) superfamily protein